MPDSDYRRFFPYGAPYDRQAEAMDRISAALSRGDDVLFEGACGTGKTLAALAPALDYARRADKTVVITTNVHQQMRQFVQEARAITRTEPIRSVVFRGKASMCHIDVGYEECQSLREATRDQVDVAGDVRQLERRERQLLERSRGGDADAAAARSVVMDELRALEDELEEIRSRNTCDRYRANLETDPAAFEAWLFDDVRTPDEVYDWAHDREYCGYELLKEAMDTVDLAVCNYHHLLDPLIRTQFFRWLDRDPSDVVVVFDEAHNVEAAAREHASRSVTERTLDAAVDECREADDPRADAAANVIETFRDALAAGYRDALGGAVGAVGESWEDVPVANADRRDDLTLGFLDRYAGRGIDADLDEALTLGTDLEERYEEAFKRGETDIRRESATLAAAGFVQAYLEEGTAIGQYPVVSVRRDAGTGEVYGRAELFACIPREVTRTLFDEVHATVLMSATLRPFDVTADVLGVDEPVAMAYGLGFPEANRRTFAVDVPPLFASTRDDPEVQSVVAGVLADAVRFTPGNTLAFFPSYGEAARYADRVETGGSLYLDAAGEPVEALRRSFVADDGAALFTSLWGTLTEGVSFDGDDATTVVVVGVPYPRLDDRVRAVQDAYDEAFGDRADDAGWAYAVEAPTVRKTRQALGRALRAPDEVGARVLVDRRYTAADMGDYGVRGTFPPEERAELVDTGPDKLRYAMLNFFTEHAAWDGDPPAPDP